MRRVHKTAAYSVWLGACGGVALSAGGCGQSERVQATPPRHATEALLPVVPPPDFRHHALEGWIAETLEPLDREALQQEIERIRTQKKLRERVGAAEPDERSP